MWILGIAGTQVSLLLMFLFIDGNAPKKPRWRRIKSWATRHRIWTWLIVSVPGTVGVLIAEGHQDHQEAKQAAQHAGAIAALKTEIVNQSAMHAHASEAAKKQIAALNTEVINQAALHAEAIEAAKRDIVALKAKVEAGNKVTSGKLRHRPGIPGKIKKVVLGGFMFASELKTIDGGELFTAREDEHGRILISAILFDADGREVANIEDNEFELNKDDEFTLEQPDLSSVRIFGKTTNLLCRLVSADTVNIEGKFYVDGDLLEFENGQTINRKHHYRASGNYIEIGLPRKK